MGLTGEFADDDLRSPGASGPPRPRLAGDGRRPRGAVPVHKLAAQRCLLARLVAKCREKEKEAAPKPAAAAPRAKRRKRS